MTSTGILTQPSKPAAEKLQLRVPQSSYIPTLDGWRAIAISMVLLGHGAASISRTLGAWFDPAKHFFESYGLLGVRIFFGISGYLITSRLIAELQTQSEGSLKRFYIRRAFRILPPAVTYLAVIGILMLAGAIAADLKGWLAAMFFCVNYVGATWYVGHFWSLAVEEHFYLLWPALLALMGTRRGLWAAVIGAGAFILWRGVRFYMHWYSDGTVWGQTDFQLDGLLWGAAFACLCGRPRARQILNQLLSGYRGYVVVALFVATLALPEFNWKFQHCLYALQAFVIPLLLLVTVLHPGRVIGRMLEMAPLRWIGHISYSLYLWQELFLPSPQMQGSHPMVLQTWPLNFIFIFACAAGSYYLVEQPMIRLGGRFSKRAPAKEDIRVELAKS